MTALISILLQTKPTQIITNAEQIKCEIIIEAYIMNFMDLKLTLWLINKTIENKNKEKKHTYNSVDVGFDKTFYYKQNKLK